MIETRRKTLPRLGTAALLLLAALGWRGGTPQPLPPNLIILFADDLGYGDLGAYGHPTIRTPHLDRMAAEGMRFTQFYVGASVCTPSRAALLTGRLPVRTGMASDQRRVLFPNSAGGLPQEEVTMAELLKEAGYATACIGKWHLGHLPPYLPTRHGFDIYFGIPYSNDMDVKQRGDPPIPLMRDEAVVEQPADQTTLTRRYTEEALRFIRENRDRPFFLYLPHTFPHVPLYASDEFEGKSPRGRYGDVVEELDWSAGQILAALRELGLAERTLVVFTSDNGPWLTQHEEGGSAGLLREGKGSTWEGGMRVPALFWWPGTIQAGVVSQALATTMDLFPTAVSMAGAEIPGDRTFDGVSLLPVLTGTRANVREDVYFYRGTQLYAVRQGPWKAHFITRTGYGGEPPVQHDPPALYHLEHDPSELRDVAAENAAVLEDIQALVARHRAGLQPAPTQLDTLLAP